MSAFRAIWPIADPSVPVDELFAEAIGDLPEVAWRYGLHVDSHTEPRILAGRYVPGSGGAQLVVLIDAAVTRLRDMKETAA